ncbi:MAG: hypothetical protein HZB67_00070 [Candidatus Aenigmarchaeota archaeon]|nr:hypothetical protein [Candidatus Aenigmarchaeota archaeon]
MASLEEYARKKDVRGIVVTAIMTSFAFVMAFFWNDAIKSAIEDIVPTGDKLTYKFTTALMVTVIVIFAAWLVIKTQEISKKHEKELEKIIKKQSAILEKHRKAAMKQSLRLRKKLIQ